MTNKQQIDEQTREETIDSLRLALEDRHQTIRKFAEQAEDFRTTIQALTDRITARETELNSIYRSRAWKWVNRYARIKKWVWPASARPRQIPAHVGLRRSSVPEVYYSLPDELVPPPDLQAYVGGGFRHTGPTFLKYLRELCGLQPHAKVLDVGCGSGRMALPLTSYLNQEGRYEGFDISSEAIKWCAENITPRFPNFHFQIADVLNPSYNAAAKYRPADYTFPYEDNYFDLVLLASVFTHMLPRDMEPYLAQISRVLKPGGRGMITFFLLNPESRQLMPTHAETYFNPNYRLNFAHEVEPGCQAIDPNKPEDALAYDETFIRRLFEKHGLAIAEPIHYGSWCGRAEYLSLQDIVVAVKEA